MIFVGDGMIAFVCSFVDYFLNSFLNCISSEFSGIFVSRLR